MSKCVVSNEEIMEIVKMRLDGATLQEIAVKRGCSRQNIEQILKRIKTGAGTSERKIIYPGLRAWMAENWCSVSKLADACGIIRQTMYVYLSQAGRMKIGAVQRILNYTGLTFEEAFGTEEFNEKR